MYRDNDENQRFRIQVLRDETGQIYGSLDPLLWTLLPADVVGRIESLRASVAEQGQPASTQLGSLEQYRAALLEVLERLPELQHEYCTQPEQPPDLWNRPLELPLLSQWLLRRMARTLREVAIRKVRSVIADVEPDAEEYLSVQTTLSLVSNGMPLALQVTPTERRWLLAVSVPCVFPPLFMETQRSIHRFLKPLGIQDDKPIDRGPFDSRFIVQGSKQTARLLDRRAREGLCWLAAKRGRPTLQIRHGQARLQWRSRGALLLPAACDLLGTLARCASAFRLRVA